MMKLMNNLIWKLVSKRKVDRQYQLDLIDWKIEGFDTKEKILEELERILNRQWLYWDVYIKYLDMIE